MQTFASELDKLEHDKLLSFVTDRIRGMNYPVDQASDIPPFVSFLVTVRIPSVHLPHLC